MKKIPINWCSSLTYSTGLTISIHAECVQCQLYIFWYHWLTELCFLGTGPQDWNCVHCVTCDLLFSSPSPSIPPPRRASWPLVFNKVLHSLSNLQACVGFAQMYIESLNWADDSFLWEPIKTCFIESSKERSWIPSDCSCFLRLPLVVTCRELVLDWQIAF